ncbi:hypothetical protein GW17_00027816 [Ensete ventricosum]|nr:hypothetical protein GW17_00027816 [Ensete ventricosum]RZS02259.1 hypothetical protein BHM03_00032268 [Ensete ventricosum]
MPAPYRVLLFFAGTCCCHHWLFFVVIFQSCPSLAAPTALDPPLQPTHTHSSVRSSERIAATVVALAIPDHCRCILCSLFSTIIFQTLPFLHRRRCFLLSNHVDGTPISRQQYFASLAILLLLLARHNRCFLYCCLLCREHLTTVHHLSVSTTTVSHCFPTVVAPLPIVRPHAATCDPTSRVTSVLVGPLLFVAESDLWPTAPSPG